VSCHRTSANQTARLGSQMRGLLAVFVRIATFAAIGLLALETHAQPRPDLANCTELKDDTALALIGSCSLHVGCGMVLKLLKDCKSATGFLGRLKSSLAGRREISNNDVFEAHAPVLTPEPNLQRHVEEVKRIVRDAPNDPDKGKFESKSSAGATVYFEGGIASGRMHGIGVYINENGAMGRGQMDSGRIEGQAQTVNANGAMFAGRFRDSIIHGSGSHQAVNGAVFSGNWNKGKQSGPIEFMTRNGFTSKMIFDTDGKVLSDGPLMPPGQRDQVPGASPAVGVAPLPSQQDSAPPGSPDYQPVRRPVVSTPSGSAVAAPGSPDFQPRR
jgi:hypothetical protein